MFCRWCAAYRIGGDQVSGLLRCGISARLTAALGHQLPSGADAELVRYAPSSGPSLNPIDTVESFQNLPCADAAIRASTYTYSITSFARASNVGGTSSPSALALVRLMTNSNVVGN